MQEKLRVAAYARVSTDKDDQTNSLENQKTYFKNYILDHEDWQLAEVYYDEGISGTQTKKRQGFRHMIEDAENKEIDLIVTKEVSRFARNTVDTLSYTRKLKDFGVGVIFTLDNIDTRDSDGEFRLTIMASIAQEESRKISERVKWGQKRQMEKGVVFGRDRSARTLPYCVLRRYGCRGVLLLSPASPSAWSPGSISPNTPISTRTVSHSLCAFVSRFPPKRSFTIVCSPTLPSLDKNAYRQSGPTPNILCRKSASQKHLAPAAQVPPRALPQLTLNVSHFVTFGSVMLGVNAPPAKVLIDPQHRSEGH